MSSPTFDLPAADRWFAVELNNLAWDLIDTADRTPEQTDRMLHAAHASLWHWMHVGTKVNHQRALCLLACAYAAAEDADGAQRYAAQCAAMSEANGDAQTKFDRAAALACAAKAHRLAGKSADAQRACSKALEIATQLDEEERTVIDAMCAEKD